jgi:hypothetical protein
MAPLSTQTNTNLTDVCTAYNVLNSQCMDGTLTIDKLETILMYLKSVGEYPIIDLTTDTTFTPDQKDATITGNLGIKREATPVGMFGTTTPPHAYTSPAVAAKDPTNSITEQTSARSDRQEKQEFDAAMQESIRDGTTVTPGKDNNPLSKKRARDNSRDRRRSLKQQMLGDIPPPVTSSFPVQKSCKSVTDHIMTTWVKAKYPIFTKEIKIHCTEDANKRKALELIAALIGKMFPVSTITYLLELNQTNADQLSLVDLFRDCGLDNVVLAQDYSKLQLSL